MNPTFRAIWNPKNRLKKDNTAPIDIVITLARNRAYIKTNIFVTKEQWDPEHAEVKKTHSRHLVHNGTIRHLIDRLENYKFDLIRANERITLDKLKNYIVKPVEKAKTFNQFIDAEITADHTLRPSTISDHKKTLAKVNAFNKSISFDAINFSMIHDFNNYLLHEGLSVNTVWKTHKTFKKYLNLAGNKGLYDIRNNPYRQFKPERAPSSRLELDFDEIKRIEELSYELENFRISKDIFLFACYTGLRYSDLVQLHTGHLQHTAQGIVIELHKMIKTRYPVNLPLYLLYNGKPEVLLKKYLINDNDAISSKTERKIFKPYWVFRTNRDLKDIGRDAKINKPLSLHIARHSFGTNTLEVTGDIKLVADLMGHRKLETTMIYQHMNQERLNRRLSNLVWQPVIKKA